MFGSGFARLGNKVVLSVSTEVIRKKLQELDAVNFITRNGKTVWTSKARSYMKNNELLQIISQYNTEIRGFYNYYAIANNCAVLDSFYNIMEYSMYKTFACKLESSVSKVLDKYYKNKVFSIPYTTGKGEEKYCKFYDEGFKRKTAKSFSYIDSLPNTFVCKQPKLINRLKSNVCELCGSSSDDLVMHQVRNLNKLKGKNDWERKMIKIRRKTLAVCSNCNSKIQNERETDNINGKPYTSRGVRTVWGRALGNLPL